MKKLFLFTVLSLVFISFSCNKEQAEKVFELDDLMVVVDEKLNDTITVAGFVTHVCIHSGQKCFITGESQEISLLVLASEEIGTFDAELVGSKIAVKGILKEKEDARVSMEDLAEMEKDVQGKIEGGESEESCAAETSSICEMRDWMEKYGKEYYAFYYMEGLSYEKLEQ